MVLEGENVHQVGSQQCNNATMQPTKISFSAFLQPKTTLFICSYGVCELNFSSITKPLLELPGSLTPRSGFYFISPIGLWADPIDTGSRWNSGARSSFLALYCCNRGKLRLVTVVRASGPGSGVFTPSVARPPAPYCDRPMSSGRGYV